MFCGFFYNKFRREKEREPKLVSFLTLPYLNLLKDPAFRLSLVGTIISYLGFNARGKLRQKLFEPSDELAPCAAKVNAFRWKGFITAVSVYTKDAETVGYSPGGVFVILFVGTAEVYGSDAGWQAQGGFGQVLYGTESGATTGDDNAGWKEAISADFFQMRFY